MEMSKELQRFLEDVKSDRNLYRKAEEIGRQMLKAGSKDSSSELLSKAVAELGYSITAAELERVKAVAEELDDDQLNGVSGGNDNSTERDRQNCNVNFSCTAHVNIPDSEGIYHDFCHRFPYNDSGDSYLNYKY